ncbi:MAG: multicopper oxidase domain-containing protein [Chloroflexi bacterium]|nr:multicopper oxidase domain-containing protein [Chloroflexota bacterium]
MRLSGKPENRRGNLDYAWLYTSAPAWKDVVIVPKMDSVTLLAVKAYTGVTMFPCHIVEHSDIGVMGEWEIMGKMPWSGRFTHELVAEGYRKVDVDIESYRLTCK